MSATLSKDLRKKYGIRSLPVRKDDEVVILRGTRKGTKGKVIQVFRKKWAIHVDKVTKNKANGAPYQLPIHPSNVAIVKAKEGKDRIARIATIAAGVNARKGKADKKIRTTNWFTAIFKIPKLSYYFSSIIQKQLNIDLLIYNAPEGQINEED